MTSYLVSFVNNFNPNYPLGFNWPQWDASGNKLLAFQDGLLPLAIGTDSYRMVCISCVILVSNIRLTASFTERYELHD